MMALAGAGLLTLSLPAADQVVLKDTNDKVSYCLGLNIGSNLKRQSIEVDTEKMAKGIKDALSGTKPMLSDQEIKEIMTAWQKEMQTKMEAQSKEFAEKNKVAAEKNKKDGEAFLDANKKKEGVKTLPSGLQYKVITDGTGASPKATDEVAVNYRGTLIDGTEFDKSEPGKPVSFPVNGVIRGWTEALQLMKPGSKWQLIIPSDLAYKETGSGPIGPNATLIFDVELLTVTPK
jgi:FKBP-type peptidyl-prolyl cis-trans isomerase FklB